MPHRVYSELNNNVYRSQNYESSHDVFRDESSQDRAKRAERETRIREKLRLSHGSGREVERG